MSKATATAPALIVAFVMEKETKNTVKYLEEGESFTHKVGALYVQKSALAELRSPGGAWPKALAVSIVGSH